MGVPWGEMKGVEHSEADPKVAALDMSELELELKFASFWAPPPAWTPPGWLRRCRGSADPELCLDLIIGGTGVDLGEMKGLAEGLCGSEACRGLMGWKLKWRFLVDTARLGL